MEACRIYRGSKLDIYYLVDGSRAYARDFVRDELTKEQQDKIIKLVQRMADQGSIDNDQLFKPLQGYPNLYEFKRFQTRLMCFYDGPSRLILTHGFKKKSDRTPPQEIDRALRLRDAYHRDKEAHHER